MIEKMLTRVLQSGGHQISFVLGQKVLIKTGMDWVPLQEDLLKINEWEDLKDICLQPNEKIQLETKGFATGLYSSSEHKWKISFVERKDCFRAYFCVTSDKQKFQCQIQNPLFWDLLKKDKGLFIFAGPSRSGKSSLVAEIIEKKENEKVNLVGIHAPENEFRWSEKETLVQLGADTLEWDLGHIIYDGLENIAVDFNSIKNWEKWIELGEQGRTIYITLTADSVKIIFQQIFEKLSLGMVHRFLNLLDGIVVQRLVGKSMVPAYELLLLRQNDKVQIQSIIQHYKAEGTIDLKVLAKENHQSLNQSLIQNLVRRQIDVKTAFSSSDNPEELDETLKKMGL